MFLETTTQVFTTLNSVMSFMIVSLIGAVIYIYKDNKTNERKLVEEHNKEIKEKNEAHLKDLRDLDAESSKNTNQLVLIIGKVQNTLETNKSFDEALNKNITEALSILTHLKAKEDAKH